MVLPEKLRALRKERGMTLKDVADAASVTPGLISQIERGKTDPSLATVRRIAAAFGADLATLFAESSPASVHVSRPGSRPGLATAESHLVYERLTPGRSDLEVLLGRLEPGEATSPEGWSHASTECTFVIEGDIAVYVEDERYAVGTGESITFDAAVRHRYVNEGSVPCRFLVSVTPPFP
ncbi:cupin domain-containing protein [Arthrobacter ginkgonis]|uniref:Cupin domain-containing protein n=1 Tax=Arthrobacter ginkgonis TaxID=1630594 RepID=A0ABP7BV96_9MICC